MTEAVDLGGEKLKGKFLKAWFVYARVDDSIHQLVDSNDHWLNRRQMEMFFSFDYVIKAMVNVATVQPLSYGYTWEVC